MKTAHIISHTHWDREWYLPYESHHMRLIMLIDQLLDAIDNDPKFNSFHLDGQTICIDDYLQVKPQNREKLMNAIESGKINIGPWYILQDAFLTSAEANVRNGYYGNIDCKRYGRKTSVGYYPDTFGIYAQAPQLLSELEIDNMIFGRGVSTTGFNNKVSNDFESKYSEMKITASSGSSVLGILFANWYSNGNEIPTDVHNAKQYWDQKLSECERYTNSNHLLFMNGCDHTPYQSDVTNAIDVANSLYQDVNFVQSSFAEYLEALKIETVEEDLTTISGELTSQTTDGFYTLVNTASSRINQKIANAKLQDKYEFVVEPLSALYADNYLHSELEYGWKKLMQNHPHDSICGCSVDSVHTTIDSRFEDSNNVSDHVINRTLKVASEQIKGQYQCGFTLFNPSEIANTRHTVHVEFARQEFGCNFKAACDQMKEVVIPNLKLIDSDGIEIDAQIIDLGIGFDYYLPDDKFRRPYYARNLEVKFNYMFDYIGHQSFYLVESNQTKTFRNIEHLENEHVKVEVNHDGSISILNKYTGRTQSNLLRIFDQGDIGNEYMFGPVQNDCELFIQAVNSIVYDNCGGLQTCTVIADLEIPESASELLATEQLEIIEYNKRQAGRSNEKIKLPIEIIYSLNDFDHGVKVEMKIKNTAKDHRLRVRFELDDNLNYHYADTAFEIVKRDNKPLSTWQNPSFDQRLAKFVRLVNSQDSLTIATCGLHEYEVRDNYVDVTLLRAVGELGDWGHFPTPDAQCIETVECSVYITFASGDNDNKIANYARSIFVIQPSTQIYPVGCGLADSQVMLDLSHDDNCYISTIKRSLDNELVVRFGSNGKVGEFDSKLHFAKTNMLEEKTGKLESNQVLANQILTVKVED